MLVQSPWLAKSWIYFDGEYWCARGIGADVFTQGRTVDELMRNIREAAALHFEEVLEKGNSLHLFRATGIPKKNFIEMLRHI
ncbi:MAG: type II toxin-antitoxin system HicB family antitoxin [Anaerolineae bacterium]|nr:type II toxin-antitoxin system HicB family antitoxin [Anaerolineae bacterium]